MSIKTYSIDSKVSDEFYKFAKKLNLNKSSFIEGKIREFLNENQKDCDKPKSYESKYRIVEKQFENRVEFTPEVTYVDKEVNIGVGGKNFNDDWHSVVLLNGNFNKLEWSCKTKEEAEEQIKIRKVKWENYVKSKNLIKVTIHEIN